MRVLQVISSLNVGSGIANSIINYYRKLDKDKCQFDFLILYKFENTFQAEVEAMGARVFFIEKPSLKTMFRFYNQVELFFSEHKGEYDAVHCQEILVQTVILPLAKKYGIKVRLVHSHSNKHKEGFVKNVRNMFLKIGYKRNATAYLGCTKEANQALYPKRIADKAIVLHNAIDIVKYKYDNNKKIQLRQIYGIDQSDFVIGHVGRLSYEKNQSFLIDIFEEVLKSRKAKLVLVGDGEDKQKILDIIKSKNLHNKVILTGSISNTNEIYSMFDIFVFPSFSEGLGIALIEAQANGLKCITSNRVPKDSMMSGNIEYLPLEDGVNVWAQTILNADTARQDNAETIASNGYSIENNIDMLLKIYGGEIK